jgi:hypothetical protein
MSPSACSHKFSNKFSRTAILNHQVLRMFAKSHTASASEESAPNDQACHQTALEGDCEFVLNFGEVNDEKAGVAMRGHSRLIAWKSRSGVREAFP